MAKFHGKDGKVEWKTGAAAEDIIDNCQSWNCSITCSTAETTGMTNGVAADNYVTRIAGLFDFTGSFEVNNDMAADIDIDDLGQEEISSGVAHEVALFLDGKAGTTLHVIYGEIILTNIAIGSAVDGITKTVYNFQGTGGAPTLAIGAAADPPWHD